MSERWRPVMIVKAGGPELRIESPYRRTDSFDSPAELYWPASVARHNGGTAQHWFETARFWQDIAEGLRK